MIVSAPPAGLQTRAHSARAGLVRVRGRGRGRVRVRVRVGSRVRAGFGARFGSRVRARVGARVGAKVRVRAGARVRTPNLGVGARLLGTCAPPRSGNGSINEGECGESASAPVRGRDRACVVSGQADLTGTWDPVCYPSLFVWGCVRAVSGLTVAAGATLVSVRVGVRVGVGVGVRARARARARARVKVRARVKGQG